MATRIRSHKYVVGLAVCLKNEAVLLGGYADTQSKISSWVGCVFYHRVSSIQWLRGKTFSLRGILQSSRNSTFKHFFYKFANPKTNRREGLKTSKKPETSVLRSPLLFVFP